MNKSKWTEAEQAKLRKKAQEKLIDIEKLYQDTDTIQTLDAFKNKFNICETVYKVILAEYLKQKNRKVNDKNLKIKSTRQVSAVLSFAGYKFEDEFISKIFGGQENSIKKLRNEITHGVNKKATSEIVSHQEELFGYMDKFLSTIKDFDAVLA